jgi:beta-glucosidase
MTSYSSWNGQKMHGHRQLVTDVLKGELAFKGLVVSDWQAIDELPGHYAEDVEQAIMAGIDLVMVPEHYGRFYQTLLGHGRSGKIPMARIDDAVAKILTAKFELGLFERPFADRSLIPKVGSAEHRAIARQAVRESLVLLKNEKKALPLSKDIAHVVLAGEAADDLGRQMGGWTISWQGKTGPVTDGTSILAAVKKAVAPTATVTFSPSGKVPKGAQAAVVVVAELPYAEMKGDTGDLELSKADMKLLGRVREAGIPTVLVVLSGRPLVLTRAMPLVDAAIAAWLPGSEGDGVADVLFGDYAPTGKLGHSWPSSMAQIPINEDRLGPDTKAEPAFAYGFGLTYEHRSDVAAGANRSSEARR